VTLRERNSWGVIDGVRPRQLRQQPPCCIPRGHSFGYQRMTQVCFFIFFPVMGLGRDSQWGWRTTTYELLECACSIQTNGGGGGWGGGGATKENSVAEQIEREREHRLWRDGRSSTAVPGGCCVLLSVATSFFRRRRPQETSSDNEG
jgi:hypothetical protein